MSVCTGCIAQNTKSLPFEVGCYVPSTKDTKTKLSISQGMIGATAFVEGIPIWNKSIMPDIADVRAIDADGKPKVVIVSFTDGTKEKAVLDESDTYSLEQGISICITKKLLGGDTLYGGALYNKVIKYAMGVKETNELLAEKSKNAAIEAQLKAEKEEKKKKARREKIRKREEERQIEIQKEAYIRAIKAIREEDREEVSDIVDDFNKLIDGIIEEAAKEVATKDKEGNTESDVNA